jgi:predicted dehydrogenase
MAESTTLNIAFVGCGGIAWTHWRGIRQHAPRLRVTAVVDTNRDNAAAMAAQTGAEIFSSLEDALERGHFDAVDLMLPHDIHVEAAESAFAAGKHVLLEKPMGRTVAECEQIMDAARRAAARWGSVFMIAEHSQYAPSAIAVRRLIRDGTLGEILTARAMQTETIRYGITPRPWRYDKERMGGGVVLDGGLHWIRPLRMWLGQVDEAIAALGYPFEEMEGESLAQVLIRFTSGVVANYESTMTVYGGGPGERFRITGTHATAVVEQGQAGRVLVYTNRDDPGHAVLTEGELGQDPYGLELADFAGAVLDGTDLAAGPEESIADLRVALAIYRSASSGHWEKA